MRNLLPYRLMIADDHEIFLDGLQAFLAKQENCRIVGKATNGKELVELCMRLHPDIVLTDIVMPVMDGITATQLITKWRPQVKCIALSMFNEENRIMRMLEAGAISYLLRMPINRKL